MKCQHIHTHQVGPDRGYSRPVAQEPYTHENRAEHGNITYIEACDTCGAQRAVNANASQYEYSPWGPTRAEPLPRSAPSDLRLVICEPRYAPSAT